MAAKRTLGKTPGGVVKAVAYREHRRGPMMASPSCLVRAGYGLTEEDRPQSQRQITLLSAERWTEVCEELGVQLVWHTRRANLLAEGIELGATIGKTIRIGEVSVLIHAETKPCALMDYLHQGLKEVMKPACRGGVYGEILTGGTIAVGDRIVVDAK